MRATEVTTDADIERIRASYRDEVIRGVAERIRSCVRPGDTVARLGGDEFTVLMVDAPTDVQLWADKYRGTLDDVFDIQERVSRGRWG
jgi:GGDEF domain-containing protein